MRVQIHLHIRPCYCRPGDEPERDQSGESDAAFNPREGRPRLWRRPWNPFTNHRRSGGRLHQEVGLPPERRRFLRSYFSNSVLVTRVENYALTNSVAPTNSPYRGPGTNNLPPARVFFSCKTPSATILANTSASRFGWGLDGSRGLRSSQRLRAFPKTERRMAIADASITESWQRGSL
jgi:hypothetical protein